MLRQTWSTYIENFVKELTALTENEKVGELNLRLLKAKAISKSTKVKDVALLRLSDIYKKAWFTDENSG